MFLYANEHAEPVWRHRREGRRAPAAARHATAAGSAAAAGGMDHPGEHADREAM